MYCISHTRYVKKKLFAPKLTIVKNSEQPAE